MYTTNTAWSLFDLSFVFFILTENENINMGKPVVKLVNTPLRLAWFKSNRRALVKKQFLRTPVKLLFTATTES